MKSFFTLFSFPAVLLSNSFLLSLVALSTTTFAANTLPQLLEKSIQAVPVIYKSSDKEKYKQYIVQFEDDSVTRKSRLLTVNKKSKKSLVNTLSQSSGITLINEHKKMLAQKRTGFISALKKKHSDAKILREYSSILNGVSVATELTTKQLKSLDNVKAVYPVRRYKRKLANALPIIDTQEAWTLLGGMENAGKGIKIAVIDSGIIQDHPMFDDTGITAPSSLPTDDYCHTTNTSFCNNKLIVARYYLPDFIDIADEGEYESPKGLSGHGSHVAGIATGRQVTATNGDTISGVAPGAYLMVYKALWGQDGEGSDIELIAAIEDAVNDGADVINNSWGGGSGNHPSTSLYQELYEELEANGVVIVTAAGNDGDRGSESISCPGCVEAGITVGATSTDLSTGLPITFSEQTLYATPSDNDAINSDISGKVGLATSDNLLGCNAWDSNELNGLIAVVTRGTCNFEVKADFAQDAGAIALIVVNNDVQANVTMSMGAATLPSVLVSKSDGQKLIQEFTHSPDITLTIASVLVATTDPFLQDWIADFSSMGPNGDDSFIKPDISAPGVGILSATSSEDSSSLGLDYTRLNGTSMATPVVAGSAALLKQYSPELSALEIKNVLINSSDSVVKNTTGERAATAFETGAGRLNIFNALNATTYAKQPNMVAKNCVIECYISNDLISFSDTDTTWTAVVKFDDESILGNILPSELTLSANDKVGSYSLSVNMPSSLDDDWYFGRVQWTSEQGQVLNQAVAISNHQTSSDLLQLSLNETSTTTLSIELNVTNVSTSEDLEIDLSIFGGAVFNDSLSVTGGNSYQVTNELDKQITVSANASTGTFEFSNESAPVQLDLANEVNGDGVTVIACELTACDEVLYDLAFDFKHFGQDFTSLSISENGFVVAGGDVPDESELFFNLSFPDIAAPNNIIAPFWTDFNLINHNEPDDEGGGEMIVGYYEVSGIEYIVLQWNKVKLYTDDNATPEALGVSSADVEFTFQLIMQENSENKWFRYIDIPEQPNFYSVGVENSLGTQGGTYWFDGEGKSSVASGDTLELTLSEADTVRLDIDVTQKASEQFSQDDNVTVAQGNTLYMNVLSNDVATGDDAVLTTTVGEITRISRLFTNDGEHELVKSTLKIVESPKNGLASITNSGLISYTANSDYIGADQLTYSVENDLGEISSSKANIEIVSGNAAPVIISSQIPTTINEGETVTFSVEAEDADSDLTYVWTIPSPLTSAGKTSSTIQATVGDLNTEQTVQVSVAVSDDETTVNESVSVTLIPAEVIAIENEGEKDKGFLGLSLNGYLQGLLILLLLSRRFVRFKHSVNVRQS